MPSTTNIYLSLQFKQLVDLVKRLSKKEKQELMNILQDDVPAAIPDWQKQEVRKRIKKYRKNPQLMVDEKTAFKMIKAM